MLGSREWRRAWVSAFWGIAESVAGERLEPSWDLLS